MKIAHISDLHLGKQLHGFSLIEDQEFILNKILSLCIEHKVEVLLVAGDIFDKNVASIDALKIFRKFLNDLVQNGIKIMIISGNHDSAERLTFGSEFMEEKGIYFSKIFDGTVEAIKMQDEFGPINFYLMPFIKPGEVKHFFPDEEIKSYDDAVRVTVKNIQPNTNERNIIIAHQAVLGSEKCDSEEGIIGGLDIISSDIFADFDYVALGHIHTPQKIGKNIVYCGSPLKYSISEMQKDKHLPIINICEKEKFSLKDVQYESLIPLRDIREIKSNFYEIIEMSKKDPHNKEDFINIILTDEDEVLDALSTLRQIYPNIIQLSYENSETQNTATLDEIISEKQKSPLEIFEDFFENRSGRSLSFEQKDYMKELIEKIWGED